jgi:hypothetical protein
MLAPPPLGLGHQLRSHGTPSERGVYTQVIHVHAESTQVLQDLESGGLDRGQKTGLERSDHLAVKLGYERQGLQSVVLQIAPEELDEPMRLR